MVYTNSWIGPAICKYSIDEFPIYRMYVVDGFGVGGLGVETIHSFEQIDLNSPIV